MRTLKILAVLLLALYLLSGVVQVRLSGACASCPSSVMTLLMGLEHELRQRVPEVEYLEAVP